MVNSEEIRKAAVESFFGTDYLRDGFITVGGVRIQGETNQADRLSAARMAARKWKDSFDLTQAKSFVCAALGADAARHTEFGKQIYEVWTTRTLYSAAHMLADQITKDSEKVEVPLCYCKKKGCKWKDKWDTIHIYHKLTYLEEKKAHRLYGDIVDLMMCMRDNMGNLEEFRAFVHDTAQRFFRSQAGGGNEDQGKDKEDFEQIPKRLRGYRWEDFGKEASISLSVESHGAENDYSPSSIRTWSDDKIHEVYDAVQREMSRRYGEGGSCVTSNAHTTVYTDGTRFSHESNALPGSQKY
jgi:hypothetical protein